ncbi:hypothetical protein GIW26_00520 [Pseudomonas syringae]|nr:hypothetical protein [Pseudomonas syringae]MCF9002556.1 hypothetical protein [Pseudomonas syringae]POP67834.1 hypothetical protein CXB35_18810 [Pseudomonas syringae]POP73915.1 hypothetical protein CXB37_21390 [Pseudomonas syringae pv. syringae]POP78236.1 hypothetical protein CXB38_22295 [Pseudomonas syringae]
MRLSLRGQKKGWLESCLNRPGIAEPLCDAERHIEDAERPELHADAEHRHDSQSMTRSICAVVSQ